MTWRHKKKLKWRERSEHFDKWHSTTYNTALNWLPELRLYPTRRCIGHFQDIHLSRSHGLAVKKLGHTQQSKQYKNNAAKANREDTKPKPTQLTNCSRVHAMQHRTVSIYLRSYPTIRKRLQKAHLRLSTVLIQSCQAREVLRRNALSIHFSNVCIGVCRVANYNHLQVNHYHTITGRLQPYNYYILCFIFNCPTKQWWVAR